MPRTVNEQLKAALKRPARLPLFLLGNRVARGGTPAKVSWLAHNSETSRDSVGSIPPACVAFGSQPRSGGAIW